MNRFARLRLTMIAMALLLDLGQSAYAQNKIVVPKPPPETGATQSDSDPESAFNSRTGDNFTWDQDKLSWINAKTGERVGFQGRIADVNTGQEAGPGTPPSNRIVVPKPPPETGATQSDTDPESAFNPRTGDNFTWDQDKLSWINAKTGESVGFQGRIVDTKTGQGVAFQGRVVDATVGEESIRIGPPPLPAYDQPLCPEPGHIWTPGYWAYEDRDYYWVPGTWVEAPQIGFLWTPGYWAWGGSAFFFHDGYWGPHVGFYGGINYGFGYGGHGYEGGRWEDNHFFYNTSVNHIDNTTIHNTYNATVKNTTENRVSYNGGNGGINARPSAQEETYDSERHTGPVAAQNQHIQEARSNRDLRASVNHGAPPIAATAKAGDFKGGAVPARESGAPYEAPKGTATGNEIRPGNNSESDTNTYNHASEVQPHKYTATSSGTASTDQKYQQQQENLAAKQNQEHQELQRQQEKEHQQLAIKNASGTQKQQIEERHSKQTQELEKKHAAQQQKMQTHQSAQRH
jgi:hypothetical protein